MISNSNYGYFYAANNSNSNFYHNNQMSNNIDQDLREQQQQDNIQMYLNNQNFHLHDTANVLNMESFNLDRHLDMNRYHNILTNNNEIIPMTDSNQINVDTRPAPLMLENCLAIDCLNLESYSSLSSSSSTSSSTTSLSSSNNKNTHPDDLNTKQKDDTMPLEMTSKLFIKNKKLNSLINSHRHSKNTQIRKSKFASAECSSCDEGYVGSYTDTSNTLTKIKPIAVNLESDIVEIKDSNLQQNLNKLLSPNDQLELLKFLLQHTFNIPLEYSEPSLSNFDETTSSKSYESEDPSFFIPTIYDSSIELQFDNLLQNPNLNQLPSYYATEFDIADKLQLSDTMETPENVELTTLEDFNSEWTWDHLDLSKNEKLLLIQEEINRLKYEQDKMDELDMMTHKWRFILERKRRLELIKTELSQEDSIDAQAYLNEIEMNIDYYTHDPSSTSSLLEVDFAVDQMLKFKTNKMAFNLRDYHRNLILKKITTDLKNQNRFSNLKVDSIQEFVPVPSYQEDFVESDEQNFGYEMNEEICEINSEQVAEDENNTLCCVDYENQEYYDEESGQQQYYFENEEDYEDYEDQMLIDNLTEEEALTLLQSESEMYALQMSQAAKLGISMNDIKDFVRVVVAETGAVIVEGGESGELSPMMLAVQSSQPEEDAIIGKEANMDSNNNDIFENVFNYYEPEYSMEDGVVEEMTCMQGHVNEYNIANENLHPENLEHLEPDLVATESFYYEDAYTTLTTDTGIDSCAMTSSTSGDCSSSASPTPYFNSNISLSLRNSLLKLRHSRRHLAVLIETNKSSSTTTTKTTASNMSLYKQHMLNMQQQSKKPCVYMLNEGRCARADCRFVHDLKTIMCKYWLEGECIKGENCEFAHEFIEETAAISASGSRRQHKSSFSSSHSNGSKSGGKKSEKVKPKKIDFKLETEDFPSLGGFPALGGGGGGDTAPQDKIETKKKTLKITISKSASADDEDGSPTPTPTPIESLMDSPKPAKTTAALLFSNITKSQIDTRQTTAVNIVPNKQPPSSTTTKNSKQTGNLSEHKSRANKNISTPTTTTTKSNLNSDGSRSTSSLSSSNGSNSRPNSALRITQNKKK